VVDIGPVAENVAQRLKDAGITLPRIQGEGDDQQIVLIDSKQLRKAQDGVDLLDRLSVVLPIVALACLVVGVVLSGNRRRSILRAALGIALAMGLLLTALNIGRSFYLDALPDSVNRAAASSVYDQLVTYLRTGLRTLFALAVIVAIAAWLAGPTDLAVRIRDGARNLVTRPAAGGQPSRVATFVGDARVVLRVVLIGLALAILVVLDHPGPLAVVVLTLLVLAGLLLIEFLARGVGRVGPVAPE
jgi:hypothetical protein